MGIAFVTSGVAGISPGTVAGAVASPLTSVITGTGAPVDASGRNGDIYLRTDGAALTTIYQRRAGAWVGIV